MALQRVRVTIDSPSLAPHEAVQWSWGVSGAVANDAKALALMTHFDARWAQAVSALSLRNRVQTAWRPRRLDIYPAAGGAATGGADRLATTLAAVGGTDMPAQVAVVLSMLVVVPAGTRPVGRTYLGPFGAATCTSGRVNTTWTASLLTIMRDWALNLAAEGLPVHVLTANGGASRGAVVGFRISNAFGIQRSRALLGTVYTDQAF